MNRLTLRLGARYSLLFAAVALTSCGLFGEKEHRAIVTDSLEPYECGSITRLHTYGGVFLASQPAPEDLRQAKDGGIHTVVNLRKPGEIEWDEGAVVEDLGLEYHNIPFSGPEELTDEVFDRVREILNDETKRPVLLHCSSANRVGAIWLAHRVLDDGLVAEAAIEEARTVGLGSDAYEAKALDYVRRRS